MTTQNTRVKLPPWPLFLRILVACQMLSLGEIFWDHDFLIAGLSFILLTQGGLIVAGLCPRCALLGPNIHRITLPPDTPPTVYLTFDDGPDPNVTPAVLSLLAQHQAQATFFCIGQQAATHPELCRAMVSAGHRVENHGQRHSPWLPFSGRLGWQKEITEAQVTLAQITGQAPRYYRAMAGLRNPFLAPILTQQGLTLVSWTRRAFDTRTIPAKKVLGRLSRHLQTGDILLLHDGHGGRTPQAPPLVLAVLPPLLNLLHDRGYRMLALPNP